MIYTRRFDGLSIDGVFYAVDDTVIGKDCEYEGLIGTITEIRTDEDKETENEGVDIYCSFQKPTNPVQISQVEETFSALYQMPKTIDDIILDLVIMAPEMLEVKGFMWM